MLPSEVLNASALGVVDLAVEGDHLPADVDRLAGHRHSGAVGQVADQVVGRGDADRQVRSIGDLAEY